MKSINTVGWVFVTPVDYHEPLDQSDSIFQNMGASGTQCMILLRICCFAWTTLDCTRFMTCVRNWICRPLYQRLRWRDECVVKNDASVMKCFPRWKSCAHFYTFLNSYTTLMFTEWWVFILLNILIIQTTTNLEKKTN